MDARVSRRHLLFRGEEPLRPPWAVEEGLFLQRCRECDRCVGRCPEGILILDRRGRPVVDFTRGGCTFCGECRTACPRGAFRPEGAETPPWTLTAQATAACLPRVGIHCQSCGDACAPRAIRFPPRLGSPAHPQIDAAACTGCGACVAVCPIRAMAVLPTSRESSHVA